MSLNDRLVHSDLDVVLNRRPFRYSISFATSHYSLDLLQFLAFLLVAVQGVDGNLQSTQLSLHEVVILAAEQLKLQLPHGCVLLHHAGESTEGRL